jgi:transposase-like protein
MANERANMGRRILTKAVLATIPEMVAQGGMRADDIAEKLGCNIGTLKVRCSQAKISLRPPGSRRGRPRTDERTIRVSGDALALLQRRAAESGKSEAALARELLETIARDDLYDAVLDIEPLPMKKRAFG